MIRITRQTDYGIVLLSALARVRDAEGPAGTRTAPELADETHLPLPMVSKILKVLARAELLASQRGVKGGYRLARAPGAITVGDMVGALEGPIAITACADGSPEPCAHEGTCPTQGNWQVINRAIREVLDRISLAEMAGRVPPALALHGEGCARGSRRR